MLKLFRLCWQQRWVAFNWTALAIIVVGSVKYMLTYLGWTGGLIGLAFAAAFTAVTFGWRPFKRTSSPNVVGAISDGGRS